RGLIRGDVPERAPLRVERAAQLLLDLVKHPPRGRELVVLLAAFAEVEERRRRWIELLARLERGASLCELACGHEIAALRELHVSLRALCPASGLQGDDDYNSPRALHLRIIAWR